MRRRATRRCCGPIRIAAHAGFDHRQTIDHVANRIVDGFERFFRAAHILDDGLHGRRRCRAGIAFAQLSDVAQQLAHAALKRIEAAEARFGRFKFLHQLGDARIKLTKPVIAGAGVVHPLDLVAKGSHHRVDVRRTVAATGGADGFDGVGDHANAAFEGFQNIVAARRSRAVVDPLSQRAHFTGQRGQSVARRHVGNNAAQPGNRRLKLLHRCWILMTARRYRVDLLRQRVYGIDCTRQTFRRRQSAQPIANFAQTFFEGGQRRRAGAGATAAVEARRENAHLTFQRFDGAARRSIGQCAGDVGEVIAQRCNSIVHPARTQGVDLFGDVAQLVFNTCEIVPRQFFAHARVRTARLMPRESAATTNAAIQLTLAHRDFGNGIVDAR